MKLFLLPLLACSLWAQDAKQPSEPTIPTEAVMKGLTPNSDMAALQAKIAEQAKTIEDQGKLLQAWYAKYQQCDIQFTQLQTLPRPAPATAPASAPTSSPDGQPNKEGKK